MLCCLRTFSTVLHRNPTNYSTQILSYILILYMVAVFYPKEIILLSEPNILPITQDDTYA
jgi:hypothetical protein